MNRRLILILLMVFIGLAAFVALQPAQPLFNPEPTATNWRDPFIFPDLTVMNIVTVNLRDPNGDKTFTISRAADGTWTAPNSTGTLDTEAASLIAQAIVLLPYQEYKNLANVNLAQFGFNPYGILFVEFVTRDNASYVFAVGELSENGENYTLVVDDRPGVYICPRGSLDFLIQSLLSPPLT